MKRRNGFVSNSSSSSFVVLVNEMTDEQKKEFKEKVNAVDWEELSYDYGHPTFSSSGKVFGGTCDYDCTDKTYTILNEMGLKNLMENLD